MQAKTTLDASTKPAPQTFPIVETENGPMTYAFGLYWPIQNDIALHLNAFRIGLKKEDGGLGRVRHLFEAKHLIWPETKKTLHDWTVRRYKAFCAGHKVITLAGGAGSSKSYDCAYYALLWWWANPEERTVLIASTTISSLTKRIWNYVGSGLRDAHGGMPGIMRTNPTPLIKYHKDDSLHCVHGIALKEGESDRTLRDIIGIHPKEALLVIVDEATDVTPAITDAIANWDKGDVKFQMICIGNSKDRLDPHGKLSKPKRGWNSVDPDLDEEWETNLGVCLYFDCYKSPAIHATYKDKLKFLINEEQIREDEKNLGKNDPKFWRFTRGFWPPDSLTKTVLSLSLVEKYNADKPTRWLGTWKRKLAALDPAVTSEGDECILRFADLGPFEDGTVGLDFGGEDSIVSLQLDARSNEPITYQIVRQVKKECLKRGVEPEFFGADTWGFGMGAGDVFQAEWSDNIHRIVSAGAATDRFLTSEEVETAYEAYDRKITELWFAMRTFVSAGQIRGLDEETIEQFCSREYFWKGKRFSLETKKEYKKRMGKEDSPTGSPDRADAAALLLEVARLNGFVAGPTQIKLEEEYNWERRWEEIKGYKGQKEAEREEMWMSDGILDSMCFGEATWEDEEQ